MNPTSPTSPTFPPPSPRSPHSPMAIDQAMGEPLPQIMGVIAPEQVFQPPTSLFSAHPTSPTVSIPQSRWSRGTTNGSSRRRNSLASPAMSPAQASFAAAAAAAATPKLSPSAGRFYPIRTPGRAYFQTTPGAVHDGRQSRLGMREHERVVTLPLRVNTTDLAIRRDDRVLEQGEWTASATSSSSNSSLVNWPTPQTPTPSQTLRSRRLSRAHQTQSRAHSPTSATRSPIRKRRLAPRLQTTVRAKPKYHVTVRPTLSPTTRHRLQQYRHGVEHLRAPLVPLISVSSGLPHPAFPTSLLQYHLLTHPQLDSLARWYHQVTPPVEETFMYPAWIPAWTAADTTSGGAIDLETKRRRFGRFIGLRGCESPTTTDMSPEKPDELARRMEREWRRALERAEEEERAWEKGWRGRW